VGGGRGEGVATTLQFIKIITFFEGGVGQLEGKLGKLLKHKFRFFYYETLTDCWLKYHYGEKQKWVLSLR
jgi:hypothetical protein